MRGARGWIRGTAGKTLPSTHLHGSLRAALTTLGVGPILLPLRAEGVRPSLVLAATCLTRSLARELLTMVSFSCPVCVRGGHKYPVGATYRENCNLW